MAGRVVPSFTSGPIDLYEAITELTQDNNFAGYQNLGQSQGSLNFGFLDPAIIIHATESQFINGQGGDDTITIIGKTDDIICGGSGNDTIYAGAGNDQLFGGSGADILFGGDGNDLLDNGSRLNQSKPEIFGYTLEKIERTRSLVEIDVRSEDAGLYIRRGWVEIVGWRQGPTGSAEPASCRKMAARVSGLSVFSGR